MNEEAIKLFYRERAIHCENPRFAILAISLKGNQLSYRGTEARILISKPPFMGQVHQIKDRTKGILSPTKEIKPQLHGSTVLNLFI